MTNKERAQRINRFNFYTDMFLFVMVFVLLAFVGLDIWKEQPLLAAVTGAGAVASAWHSRRFPDYLITLFCAGWMRRKMEKVFDIQALEIKLSAEAAEEIKQKIDEANHE